MSAQKVRGRFYWRITDWGNLLGEYSNQHTEYPRPESALRVSGFSAGDAYLGVYRSTWFEPESREAVICTLKIQPKSGPVGIFQLTWTRIGSQTPLFRGEAMASEGRLIGDYWQV